MHAICLFLYYHRSTPTVDRVTSSSFVIDGPHKKFDDGLNSAASTLASIISRQAFDIPRAARDSGHHRGDKGYSGSGGGNDESDRRSGGNDIVSAGDRRSAGGRFSLPDIVDPVDVDGSGVQVRRDSIGSGVHTRRDTPARSRDPFGSPVTPQMYNGFRYHAGNTRAAAAAIKTAAASS